MANKEALRDLQQRLSQRLQTVQTQTDTSAWLAVRVGTLPCLLPLSQSGEIFPWTEPACVPYTKPWFIGVVNLRGGLFGVVDLLRFMDAQAGVRDEQAWLQARLITFNVALGINCALVVDELSGLRRPDVFVGSERPAADAPAYFGDRLQDVQGIFWQAIDLQLLSQTAAFLDIGA